MFWSLLKVIPKNHLSYCFGAFARLELPRCLRVPLLKAFADFFRIDLETAVEPIESYPSLSAFFVRKLKPELRPIASGLISPVDARLTEFGLINEGKALQVKGRYYEIGALLANADLANLFEGGMYLTFYLSPADYHNIHSPVDGSIVSSTLVPGKLWPVNSWSLNNVDNLFPTNERIVSIIDGGVAGVYAVVMVGATNVGSVRAVYDGELVANRDIWDFGKNRRIISREYRPGIQVKKGEMIGSFYLGSTVILLTQRGCFTPEESCQLGAIKMGMTLGRIERS